MARVAAPDRELDPRIIHEYVHLLTHENVQHLPVWFDEGLSEFWMTVAVQNDSVEIGRPLVENLKTLQDRKNWIPLGQLLAMKGEPDASDAKRVAMFYAESW